MSDTDRSCPNCGEPIWSHDFNESFVGVRLKNTCNIGRVLCAQVEEADSLRTENERLSRRVAELGAALVNLLEAHDDYYRLPADYNDFQKRKVTLNRAVERSRKAVTPSPAPEPPASPQLGPHTVNVITDGIITEHKSTYQQALDKVNQPGATVEDWQNFHREAALLRMGISSVDAHGKDEREGRK